MIIKQIAFVVVGLMVWATGYTARLTDDGVIAFGKRWTTILRSGPDLHDVVYNGNRFVAVGRIGVILTSDNALDWVSRSSGTSEDLNKVIWANDRFIAVGKGGVILMSPNGETWTTKHIDEEQNLYGIAYSGDDYIAVGSLEKSSNSYGTSYGALILKSDEGENWAEVNTPNNLAPLTDVIWANQKFVVIGNGSGQKPFAWSADGTTWSVANVNSASYFLNYLSWNQGAYMATGIIPYAGLYGFVQYISDDGVTWNKTSGQSNQYVNNVKGYNGVFYGLGLNEKTVPFPGVPPNFVKAPLDTIYYSADGMAWTKVQYNSKYKMNSLAWSDTHFVVVGDNGQIIANQFSVGSIFPADGIADYLEGIGIYYDGFYPFVWSWGENNWFWVVDEDASLEDGFYFWHFGLNNWCWSNQSFFPWFYEFDPEASGYREFGSSE